MRILLIGAVDLYRIAVRPFLPPTCRFDPSCADYSREALRTHGVRRGLILAARRLLRCHPFDPGGVDLVPAHRS